MNRGDAPASGELPAFETRGLEEMPALARATDWAATPLGPMASWSPGLRLAFDIVMSGGFPMALRWGPDFLLIYNDAYRPILADKHPAAFARPSREVWAEVWPEIEPAHRAVFSGATKAVFAEDLPLRLKRHGERWDDGNFTFSYSPMPDATAPNGIGGILVTAVETTSRVEAERALRQTQAELSATNRALEAERAFLTNLFQNAPSFMAVLRGPDHRFELANDAYQQLVGHRELVGRTVRAALPDIEGQGFYELLDDVFRTGRPFNGRALKAVLQRHPGARPEERYVDLMYQPFGQTGSEDAGIFVEGFDVTDRIVAETALQRLNQSLEQEIAQRTHERDRVWQNAQDLFVVINADATIAAANPAWTTLLGWSPEEVAGRHFLAFIHPDDHESGTNAYDAAQRDVLPNVELRIRHKDATYRWISWAASPDGERVFASGRHITAQKQAEEDLALTQEALRQSQKMEAVGQLTGGIAHDFNNLLQGITGSLDLVQKRIGQGRYGDLDRFLTGAMSAATRAAALTHRLLAFSRRQPLDPRPVEANPLVSSMDDLLRRTLGERISLNVQLAADLWLTRCDPNQLENAILNLAINARDAMPEGGRLTIETCNARFDVRDALRSRDVRSGDYVCIVVTDNGTGMSADTLAKAFDPFFTTKPLGQGTGLGLSMIYGFAHQSGGEVRIQSQLGKGTIVKLYLPRHLGGADADDSATGGKAPHAEGAGETVLVVEDEPVVRALILEILADLGYQALEAADGPSGLAILQSDARIDLLVSDVGLPGLNGRQLADAARLVRPGLKVLFMTGYAESMVGAAGSLAPGMTIITKPFAMEVLASRIRAIIADEG